MRRFCLEILTVLWIIAVAVTASPRALPGAGGAPPSKGSTPTKGTTRADPGSFGLSGIDSEGDDDDGGNPSSPIFGGAPTRDDDDSDPSSPMFGDVPDIHIDPHDNTTYYLTPSASSSGRYVNRWRGKLKCETSWASPTFTEIDQMVSQVMRRPNNKPCTNYNGIKSKCSKLESAKGGTISLCGHYGANINCPAVVYAAHYIRYLCANLDIARAGGSYTFANRNSLRTVVH